MCLAGILCVLNMRISVLLTISVVVVITDKILLSVLHVC